ncbi:HEPN domain-containing protein [Actinoplanes regularis]|uniref:HEPN domain-containing protein n=1 Tax=Actinoplanes regularis TaxID=52697 RepID=UPI0024A1FA11|nr:HEPN domain-containing protein [Actinoplanes regularis]GLW31452.1 hypothetical protein Areg01_43920 [Actinoplanes regularis]
MAGRPKRPEAVDLLVSALEHLQAAPGRTPWDHGWCVEDYRRSEQAALTSPNGPVSFQPKGVDLFEQAVMALLSRNGVRERWVSEEIWGLVASLLVHASISADSAAVLAAGLATIEKAQPALVCFPVANVGWNDDPCVIKNFVIGEIGPKYLDAVRVAAVGRPDLSDGAAGRWIDEQVARLTGSGSEEGGVVAFTTWTKRQGQGAFSQAEESFDTLIGLALLLEEEVSELGLYSGRGNSHRPGIRGLTLHRPALDRAKKLVGHELYCQPLVVSELGHSSSAHWYGEKPFPFQKLIKAPERIDEISACMNGEDAVSRRMRVAARWYAEAHWSFNSDDAVLAIGIALDALLGSRAGLPGRAMSERFALLEPDAAQRRDRARVFGDLYQARSATAHGGKSSRLLEPGFTREMERNARWVARRLLNLSTRFAPSGDEQLDKVFEDLRWGTSAW